MIRYFLSPSWQGVSVALASYLGMTWALLWLAGESQLTDPNNFLYWTIVTASTVGYGDAAPASFFGKLIVALFVIPFGLGIFAMLIGNVAGFMINQWKRGLRGLKPMHVESHILVIGWNGHKSVQLLRLLVHESKNNHQRKIVLCVTDDIENPMPEEIGFVRVSSFIDNDEMQRAAIDKASGIIISTPTDDTTMTTALYCHSVNPNAHTIVYLSEDSLGDLLRQHCPGVECMPSIAIEMQAKAIMDPGSSALHQELLNGDHGMTQYATVLPDHSEPVTVDALFEGFKSRHNATLIGVAENPRQAIAINPELDRLVRGGETIYYIAKQRINFDWEAFRV